MHSTNNDPIKRNTNQAYGGDFAINADAPVISRGEIEVNAPPEMIWEIMATIDRWSDWNPDVSWTALEGDLAPGTTFRWKSGPGVITSTLQRVDQPRFIAWTGSTMGIQAVHVWRILPLGTRTKVVTEESWQGFIVRLLRGSMQNMLDKAVQQGLQYLKEEAERRNAQTS